MSSLPTAPPRTRILLGAPVLLALSLSWGCATQPHRPLVSTPDPAPAPQAPPPMAATPAPRPVPAPVSQAPHEVTTPAEPARAPRIGPKAPPRDAALASPPIAGTTEESDASELQPLPTLLQESEIRQVFEDNHRAIDACYRIEKDRTARGAIVVSFVIDAQGQILSLWPVAEEVGNPKVLQCVLNTVSKLSFRATPGGTSQVTYTIRNRS